MALAQILQGVAIAVLIIAIALDFVSVNLVGKGNYKDTKAAAYASAGLSILALLLVGGGMFAATETGQHLRGRFVQAV